MASEEGPDPNEVRRHAKRMYTEEQYRKKYRRLDYYQPNQKQANFHALQASEKMLQAGNQQGKTHATGFEFASHSTAIYPGWWGGRRFIVPPRIERPFEWMGWASCTTSTKVRDGAQLKLLGPVRDAGGLGTGLIPLDSIVGKPTMARGIADFVDTVTVRRETGGTGLIRFKTYEMGREAYQGEPVDVNWLDEDVSRDDDSIYGEVIARKTTTRGIIVCSLSPLLGMSPLMKRFKARDGAECARVIMTLEDCAVSKGGHIPDEDIPAIIASYDENERSTRVYGIPAMGQGAVFSTPVDRIKHDLDPADVPNYWRWLWALDFRHSGSATSGHPFAAALLCRDMDNDVIYVMAAFRMLGLAPAHVARIKENPMREAPVAWPHDGGRGASIVSGETVAKTYKGLGLNMLPDHATFEDGGFSFEAGISEMEERFGSQRLRIARHLAEAFDEYSGYHRKDGLVVKVDDDIMSAIRVGVMAIRKATAVERFKPFNRQRLPTDGRARGTDFDPFTGR